MPAKKAYPPLERWGLAPARPIPVNPVAWAIYEQGKGGIIDQDLVRLARDYLHVDLSAIAGIFLIFFALIPALIFLLYRHRGAMHYIFTRLFLVKLD